jgi:MoaA/NifB/PqqE/SkfB family radical SAM enzyme
MTGINLAIGPSCFVRCRGCYNFFGNTHRRGGLISATELLDFVAAAQKIGVRKATLSGGDPLTHPEVLTIIRGITELGLSVKLDTVGTALLDDASKLFYGQGEVPKIAIDDIARYVEVVGLPLDGSRDATVQEFRVGRPNLIDEIRQSVALLTHAGVRVCINTVVHRLNIHELNEIQSLVTTMGADQWQLFEFQPTGPLGSRNAEALELASGVFDRLVRSKLDISKSTLPQIECKSRRDRQNLYFMIDDAGIAWLPNSKGATRTIVGHITSEREAVMSCLSEHLRQNAVRSVLV